jgi:hypothetical protein
MPAWRIVSPKKWKTRPLKTSPKARPLKPMMSPRLAIQSRGMSNQPPADARGRSGPVATGQPPIGARGLAPQKIWEPIIPIRCTNTMLRIIDLAVAWPTPTGPPEAV